MTFSNFSYKTVNGYKTVNAHSEFMNELKSVLGKSIYIFDKLTVMVHFMNQAKFENSRRFCQDKFEFPAHRNVPSEY